ncbi:MAG: cation:dicarboxylase symporter family transporter [Anaerolineaceae bacterium]|nr:cation:dicarboxylase symporter family transporter [Anaerolineaceae bacterium]
MFNNFLSAKGLDIVLFIVIMLLFVGTLVFMASQQKKHVKFGARVLWALVLGIVFGLILQLVFGATSNAVKLSLGWIKLVGNIYVGFLQMIIIPLVLVSIMTAIANMSGQKNIGKVTSSIIGVLLITTAIAALIGALTTGLFGLNTEGLAKDEARVTALETRSEDVNQTDITGQIYSFIPTNAFRDMTGARSTSTIAVVIFATFLGFGMLGVSRKKPALFETLRHGLDALQAMVMEVVKIVLRLTPYGIMALITSFVVGSNWEQILKLVNFVLISYLAILIMYLVHFVILAAFGMNPITYLTKAWSTLVFAFFSRTSAGTLPMTVKTQTDRLGVPEGIANIGSSLALTIGQNGCAGIYPAMLAVMVAPSLGINPFDPLFLLKLVLIVTISSFGIAGVGGGATFAGLVVLSSMGFPVWIAALLISIEPLIDMARTSLNVSDAFVANLVTAKLQGQLNMEIYNNPSNDMIEEAV